MPEGPECHSIAISLNSLLKSKNIKSIVITGGRYQKHGPPDGYTEFCQTLTDKHVVIEDVLVKGKLIYWVFSNDFVMLNTLGMSGCWTSKCRKHCDVHVEYDDKKIWFQDQRHFGTIKFIHKSKLGKKLESLGCDVLTEEFTESQWQYLCGRYNNKTLPALIMN